ncbi:MAG: hypothetical protein GXY80_11460 [Syntrophorhabdus aromaticivorans]|uniref:Uncharacterized protein n=1 Tax=Syntrophorhabdus aromaticivorans TaxID=328301 RepID=A0A351U6J7_9BACT|nr:hypothetical protein [Syntrophorhabdus aromaticivorans]HBA55578.1 hypothetical protein [Syntrophorhabdus aromaticivorans]
MKRLTMAFAGIVITAAALWAGPEKIEVFPGAPYERLTIYENLIIFWIGIIGLVVIIGMKLREIQRIRKMGIDREEKDIPLLD